jgi:hypothetical protein
MVGRGSASPIFAAGSGAGAAFGAGRFVDPKLPFARR